MTVRNRRIVKKLKFNAHFFTDTFIEMEHAEYKVFENASQIEVCAVIRPAGCKPSIEFPVRIVTRPDSAGTYTPLSSCTTVFKSNSLFRSYRAKCRLREH